MLIFITSIALKIVPVTTMRIVVFWWDFWVDKAGALSGLFCLFAGPVGSRTYSPEIKLQNKEARKWLYKQRLARVFKFHFWCLSHCRICFATH